MSRGRCFVELVDGNPIRVFRNGAMARVSNAYNEDRVREWPRIDAVRAIRTEVFKRANNQCERCGSRLTWNNGEMDEKIPRGQGGEISIENCWLLCHGCHQGHPNSKHGNRIWGGRRET
jgi:5-methylcytosine-specific restriction endonuclease McrA